MQIITGAITEIIADPGYILINKNDEVMAHHLWLSITDTPENWLEVLEEQVKTDG